MNVRDPALPPPLRCFRFGSAEFDESRFELRVGGLAVDLQHKPLRLLSVLLHTADQVVDKGTLFEAVWGNTVTVEHVLANAVSKLRAALGPDNAAHVVTVPRRGYRLAGPVEAVLLEPPPASVAFVPAAGRSVPGRESFVLERLLGRSPAQATRSPTSPISPPTSRA